MAASEFTAVDDESLSAEALQLIKARTMFQMVEEVPSSSAHGGAVQMQVDPGFSQWTPRLLSALETNIDKLLSNFAFNFNLRPSSTASPAACCSSPTPRWGGAG